MAMSGFFRSATCKLAKTRTAFHLRVATLPPFLPTVPNGATLASQRSMTTKTKRFAESFAKQFKQKLLDKTQVRKTEDQIFKTWVPSSPSIRHKKMVDKSFLWKGKPVLELTEALRKKGGRNNTGRITVRHRGGGFKRRIRLIDFHRRDPGPHTVERLEYDPNRSPWIALLKNQITGGLSYIIAPNGVKEGDVLRSWRPAVDKQSSVLPLAADSEFVFNPDELNTAAPFRPGNCMPLKFIPIGTTIHCISLKRSGKAKMCRSAGTSATLVTTGETGFATVKLQSEEIRKVPVDAVATIGSVCNPHHKFESLGSAGARRRRGWRPTVRGVAMNSCDHPHGGGRGKSQGNRHPVSPWGKLAKGGKTVRTKNPMVVKARPRR